MHGFNTIRRNDAGPSGSNRPSFLHVWPALRPLALLCYLASVGLTRAEVVINKQQGAVESLPDSAGQETDLGELVCSRDSGAYAIIRAQIQWNITPGPTPQAFSYGFYSNSSIASVPTTSTLTTLNPLLYGSWTTNPGNVTFPDFPREIYVRRTGYPSSDPVQFRFSICGTLKATVIKPPSSFISEAIKTLPPVVVALNLSTGAMTVTNPNLNPPPDNDGDGIPDDQDPDDDNDGIPDGVDPDPKSPDTDGDGIPNPNDPDDDGDGIPDNIDPNPLDPTPEDPPTDTDGDGLPDNDDPDDDNDGIPDSLDPDPTNPPPDPDPPSGPDHDGDGTPDDQDPDDDNDGIPDGVDPAPKGPLPDPGPDPDPNPTPDPTPTPTQPGTPDETTAAMNNLAEAPHGLPGTGKPTGDPVGSLQVAREAMKNKLSNFQLLQQGTIPKVMAYQFSVSTPLGPIQKSIDFSKQPFPAIRAAMLVTLTLMLGNSLLKRITI